MVLSSKNQGYNSILKLLYEHVLPLIIESELPKFPSIISLRSKFMTSAILNSSMSSSCQLNEKEDDNLFEVCSRHNRG